MKFYSFSAICLLALITFSSCKKSFQKSPDGSYEYIQWVANSGAKAQEGDEIQFNYRFRKDKEDLESTYKLGNPAKTQIPANAKAPLLFRPFYLMAEGDSITVKFVPDSLKNMLPPTILSRFKAGEKIEVDLKIIKVRKKDDVEKERVLVMAEMDAVKRDSAIIAREASNVEKILVQDINDYNEGKLKDKLKSTPNGVEYMVHQPGNGAACAKDKIVMVYYLGMLVEGAKKFDSSFDRGSGFPFRMGGKSVIPGWEEGISPLKEGDDATIFIPASLGYGDKGAGEKIPPGARLAFYIHVRKVI